MTVVGFDFGTTNSLISVVRGKGTINYLDDEQRPIPSVVCYEGKQTIVGREARERLSHSGLGVQGNIVRSPKLFLGRDGVFIEGVERSPVDIVADVVRHVLHEARASRRGQDLGQISGAVVTIPVDMEGYKRRALRDAFRLAGLNIKQFVHEPLSALYGYFRTADLQAMLRRYDRKLILVFDWGGGTLDLTLCRTLGRRIVQIMNDGTEEVGGDVFDESIMNSLIKKVCTLRGIESTVTMYSRAKARLLNRCERAKMDLSARARSQVYVGSFFKGIDDEDFDYSLNQEELEKIVAPLIDKGFKRIESVLKNAGFDPEQVALCLATGGMSNMPAIRRRLHEWFGPERVQVPESTATIIAEGAAWIASDEAGLQMAKNIELTLARNSYLPLVKVGTEMPREGEVQSATFHLYCTDPRDGVAKFQICEPRSTSEKVLPNEPRIHLSNLTVKVDRMARPFHERLELDIRIDDDLILEAHARSLNARDQDRQEIHNLEFGLAFPCKEDVDEHQKDSFGIDTLVKEQSSTGTLSIRANLADRENLRLIPGECLYEYDPRYFDTRHRPPDYQVHEMLYYQPCAKCGRASNDPLCICVSQIPGARPVVGTPSELEEM
ncbi:Hsp70 family protein [Desulfatiglans anilini]|uniref:Hsp70 family protein n=1 Tax=Desulfatiglans anilini TaxID=90728 RepID=UPI0003F5B110|nr:Hsp70 family protein [Desulfatiglans anilini]